MNLNQSLTSLLGGGVIAIPTDTVYGLACIASNKSALSKLNTIKRQRQQKDYVRQVATIKQAKMLIHPDQHEKLDKIAHFWPGEITFIFKAKQSRLYPPTMDTIAIRIPNHPLALSLLKKIGEPLIVTSLNRSGAQPILSAESIPDDLLNELDGILVSERSLSNVASTIIDLSLSIPKIIRQGNINFDISLSL